MHAAGDPYFDRFGVRIVKSSRLFLKPRFSTKSHYRVSVHWLWLFVGVGGG